MDVVHVIDDVGHNLAYSYTECCFMKYGTNFHTQSFVGAVCVALEHHKNDLILNIEKTCAISFNSHQNRHPCRPHIIFNRNDIAYSSELKFLGAFITDNLAWNVQIHSLCASLSKAYYMTKS